MKLSVVTTLYHSAPYIEEFYRRTCASAEQLVGDDFEIIFVNDGSPDQSLSLAVSIANRDNRVTVINLSRNFGHHKAMMTGLTHAAGQKIFLVDSDLEEMPEWLVPFDEVMNKEDAEVVYGVQRQRKGSFLERITGFIFYRLFRLLTGIAQPNNIVTARLMTSNYVRALTSHHERELNIGGLWVITGFKQIPAEVNKLSTSPTTYSLRRKFSHFVNAITSFSSKPLVAIFYIGLLVFLTSILHILYLGARYYFVASPPDGYTSIIASIWLFFGLIIIFMGIQGIYIAKIFAEVKQRPNTIISYIHKKKNNIK